jgi:hypothetical protein
MARWPWTGGDVILFYETGVMSIGQQNEGRWRVDCDIALSHDMMDHVLVLRHEQGSVTVDLTNGSVISRGDGRK